jgi:cytoskeleton protein RodZ
VEEAATDPAPPPSLGQYLAAERERQGLSRGDVAQRLHMSTWQVECLETGDYSRLPQGTFLRGFVRNYAKVLELDVESTLSRLAEAAPRRPAPGIVVPSQNIRFDPIGQRLANPYVKASGLAAVALAFGFAVMYWWLFVRPAPPAAQVAAREQSQPAPRNLAAAPVPPPEPVVPREAPKEEVAPAVEPAAAEPQAKPASPPAPPASAPRAEPGRVEQPRALPAASTVAARDARTVRLRFKGKSWVEIKDRSGRVLMSQLNDPGSEAEVSGRPPFSVIVGNAPDVTLLYDEREFALGPHTRVAVARFTLD